jgi:hypothetical protein
LNATDRARLFLDEQAVQPLLSADIAGMVRALSDVELLAVVAPELRRRLGLGDIEASTFPRPSRRTRLLRRWHLTRALRRHQGRKGARWERIFAHLAEPLPAAPAPLEDLGPLEDDGPYVCPGCLAVASRCAPGCPEARMEREQEEREDLDPDEGDEREAWPPEDPAEYEAETPTDAPAPAPRRLPLVPEQAPPIVLRAPPPPPPAHLYARPIAQLTSAEQRFKCVPFSAVLSASTCIERQSAANVGRQARTSAGVQARAAANVVSWCRNCDLGKSVAAQIARVA